MTKRGISMALAAVLVAATAACTPPGSSSAQTVELVAGGGEADGGPAADAFIDGRFVDLTADRTGTLRVLTDDKGVATLWTVRDGTLSRVPVPGLKADYVSQMTVGPDGGVYVALWNGEGGIWQLTPEGKAVRRLGIDRSTYTGERVPPADGAAVDGAYLQYLHGVAVGPGEQLYFAEERIRPTSHQLIRTVDRGRIRTVLGRDLTGLTARQWRSARTKEGGFPDGTPGPQIAVESGLTSLIALGADGTVYSSPGRNSIVAVGPDGRAHELIGNIAAGGRDGDVPEADQPFADRGPAAKAAVRLRGATTGRATDANASLVVDGRGNLYATSSRYGDDLPDAFDWTGDATGRQRDLLEQSRKDHDAALETTEVLQIRPDGSLATAAGNADAAAVSGDWLYLARAFTDDEGEERVIVVRTAIPR